MNLEHIVVNNIPAETLFIYYEEIVSFPYVSLNASYEDLESDKIENTELADSYEYAGWTHVAWLKPKQKYEVDLAELDLLELVRTENDQYLAGRVATNNYGKGKDEFIPITEYEIEELVYGTSTYGDEEEIFEKQEDKGSMKPKFNRNTFRRRALSVTESYDDSTAEIEKNTIARKFFTSLIKTDVGKYAILNDYNFVKTIFADSDAEAIQQFNIYLKQRNPMKESVVTEAVDNVQKYWDIVNFQCNTYDECNKAEEIIKTAQKNDEITVEEWDDMMMAISDQRRFINRRARTSNYKSYYKNQFEDVNEKMDSSEDELTYNDYMDMFSEDQGMSDKEKKVLESPITKDSIQQYLVTFSEVKTVNPRDIDILVNYIKKETDKENEEEILYSSIQEADIPFLMETAPKYIRSVWNRVMGEPTNESVAHPKEYHFLIVGDEVGEFLVGATSEEEAIRIAKEEVLDEDEEFESLGTVSEWEAENSGLDEF